MKTESKKQQKKGREPQREKAHRVVNGDVGGLSEAPLGGGRAGSPLGLADIGRGD